jgi:hypothetical protein
VRCFVTGGAKVSDYIKALDLVEGSSGSPVIKKEVKTPNGR